LPSTVRTKIKIFVILLLKTCRSGNFSLHTHPFALDSLKDSMHYTFFIF